MYICACFFFFQYRQFHIFTSQHVLPNQQGTHNKRVKGQRKKKQNKTQGKGEEGQSSKKNERGKAKKRRGREKDKREERGGEEEETITRGSGKKTRKGKKKA